MGRAHARPLMARLALALAMLLSGPLAVGAHTTSTGLLTLTVSGSTLQYRLTLVLSELPGEPARLLALAAEGDAEAVRRVSSELARRVIVRAGDVPCHPGRAGIQGSRVGDSRVILDLTLRCPPTPARLLIRDDWFELFGEHYRTLARLETPGGVREAAFLPDAREVTVELAAGSPSHHENFFRLGVEHILTGYDHLLFLAALMLGGGRLLSLLKIVTAFTLAHSITLALAVLGVVAISDRLVEPVIAVSIVWVSLENVIRRDAGSERWLVSFLFGLVHGFGFASALTPLALPARNLALALVGFNLGVEAGQALVVLALLPLLIWLRGSSWQWRVVRTASLAVALVGAGWLVQRLL